MGWDFQCPPFRKGPIITLRMAGGFAYKVGPKLAANKHKLLESQRKPCCRLIFRMSSKSKGPWARGIRSGLELAKLDIFCVAIRVMSASRVCLGGWESSECITRVSRQRPPHLPHPQKEADTLSFLCLHSSLEKAQTPVRPALGRLRRES